MHSNPPPLCPWVGVGFYFLTCGQERRSTKPQGQHKELVRGLRGCRIDPVVLRLADILTKVL